MSIYVAQQQIDFFFCTVTVKKKSILTRLSLDTAIQKMTAHNTQTFNYISLLQMELSINYKVKS
jgi:hypothetical protein